MEGQLKIGKQGVYLIQRDGEVTSFKLVSWAQLTQTADLTIPGPKPVRPWGESGTHENAPGHPPAL